MECAIKTGIFHIIPDILFKTNLFFKQFIPDNQSIETGGIKNRNRIFNRMDYRLTLYIETRIQ